MNRQQALQFLKNNPVFWSRLGFGYDPPMKNEQGAPLVFTEDLERYARTHRMFSQAGVLLHTCILHAGWMGVDEFDYRLTDRVVEAVFRDNPDAYYIPRIKLNVPVDWCRENPQEVFVYYQGPRDAQSIRDLVDTEKHDWLGYNAPNGYYQAGDYVDTRPNVGGVIARQSFSSKKWLCDAGLALEKLIDRLENGPYGSRILGYHIAFGASGESVMWGRMNNHYGDYGISHTRHFINWGLKKYGSWDALRRSWGEERFANDTVLLPSPDERYGRKDSLASFYRADCLGRISSDMDEFLSECCADAIEHFCKIVRRRAPEKLTGIFYGYFVHINNPNYAGHLSLERLLKSEHVDFIAAPKSYYRCGPGQPGGELTAVQSVNLKKIWLDETDCRTHLAYGSTTDNAKWLCRDFRDSRCVLWREFCKNISHGSGFWWMDLGGGWYDDPELMEEIRKMTALNQKLKTRPFESLADILVLADENVIGKMSISKTQREGFLEDPLMEICLSGAVADFYRLTDLPQLDLNRYKMVIFAYTFDVSSQTRQYLKTHLPPETFLVYHHAAGVIRDGVCATENIRDFTGFSMEERETGSDYVGVTVCDEGAKLLFDGVWQKGNRVAITLPYQKAPVYRALARLAGCRLWTSGGISLWADRRVMGVFTQEKLQGTLRFPEKGAYREIISNKLYSDAKEICLEELHTNVAVFVPEK